MIPTKDETKWLLVRAIDDAIDYANELGLSEAEEIKALKSKIQEKLAFEGLEYQDAIN